MMVLSNGGVGSLLQHDEVANLCTCKGQMAIGEGIF